jgi:diadenosine tetraphosphate (Ap4A) HIT family hydrolase
MPETPEEMYQRASGHLRTPPARDWDTWPFRGSVTPRTLERPVAHEKARIGEGGVDCDACSASDDHFVWRTELWQLQGIRETGLPLVLLLEPRAHYEEPGDLPDPSAMQLGVLIGRIDTAMRAVPGIARVHVGRWGEGGAHLHWWFIARPAGFEQLRSSFAAIWDDVLPPVPEAVWRENLARFLAAFDPPS